MARDVTLAAPVREIKHRTPMEVPDVENQEITPEQEICELDLEFVGELEDITAGWTGPTTDGFDGDWSE
jgi:hypothetical protein